jgi:hypothetical protein
MRGGEVYELNARTLVLLHLPMHAESYESNGQSALAPRRMRRTRTAAIDHSQV